MTTSGVNGWIRDENVERFMNKKIPQVFNEANRSRAFTKGACRVLLSHEPYKDGTKRAHLSISCADRCPTWEEIKDARYNLMPMGTMVAQLLPPLTEYVNIHEYTFHLYEINDPRVYG